MSCVQNPFSAHLKTLSPNIVGLVVYRTLTTMWSPLHKAGLPRTHSSHCGIHVTSITVSLCFSCGFISHACAVRKPILQPRKSVTWQEQVRGPCHFHSVGWAVLLRNCLSSGRTRRESLGVGSSFFPLAHEDIISCLAQCGTSFYPSPTQIHRLWQRWLPMLSYTTEAHYGRGLPTLYPNSTESYHLLDIQWEWDHQQYLSHSALVPSKQAC